METKTLSKLEHLNSLSPLTFTDDEQIKSSFIKLYMATHAGESEEDANNFYERESNYFKRVLFANKYLQQSTMFSLYGCFMDVVVNGLSFDPSANLLYVTTRGFNTGTKDNAKWENRASNTISPYGELTLRVKYGQVKYIDNPVVVYEGDTFRKGYKENGQQFIIYEATIPRCSTNIIASFVKIVRPDGSFDFPHMEKQDIERLKKYSEKQNGGEAKVNALYKSEGGGIDPGFLKAKTIRHAFKAYPKVNILGSHSSLDEEPEEITQPFTGVDNGQPAASPVPAINGATRIAEEQKQQPQLNGHTVAFDSDEF